MDVLDENRTQLPNFQGIETIPFSLSEYDFSRQSQPVVVAATQVLTTNHIIIVGGVAAAAVVVFACLVIRGPLKSRAVMSLVSGTSYKPVKLKLTLNPAFIPIFCHESDSFVAAVKSHVNLLRRYICILKASSSSHTCFSPFRGSAGNGQIQDNFRSNLCHSIIYLSPGIKNILSSDPETCNPSSAVDVKCLEALKTLRDCCSSEKDKMVHLVTFDCFQNAETAFLDRLTSFIFPHQQNTNGDPLPALKLTCLYAGRYRLQNLAKILLRLFHLSEFPAEIARCLENWRDCDEAREVEQYLYFHCESNIRDNFPTLSSLEPDTSSVVIDINRAHYSTGVSRSVNPLSNSESSDSNRQIHHAKDKNKKPKPPQSSTLRSQTKKQTKDPGHDIINSCQLKVNLPSCSLNTRSQFWDKYCLSPFYYKDFTPPFYDKKCLPTYSENQSPLGQQALHFHSENQSPLGQQALHFHSEKDYQNYLMSDFPEFAKFSETRKKIIEARVPESVSYSSKCYTQADRAQSSHARDLEYGAVGNERVLNGNESTQNVVVNTGVDSDEGDALLNGFCNMRSSGTIVPPSLSYSSCATIGSVCEQINQINDHSCWSDASLSQ